MAVPTKHSLKRKDFHEPALETSSQQQDKASITAPGTPRPNKYYPPPMSNSRAEAYKTGRISRPFDILEKAMNTKSVAPKAKDAQTVIHWFRRDLRVHDNHALHLASQAAAADPSKPKSLVSFFFICPELLEAHSISARRVDFTLRSLQALRKCLWDEYRIPLFVETVEKQKDIPIRLAALMEKLNASEVFANMEFEVDELRCDTKIIEHLAKQDRTFRVAQDDCVVEVSKVGKAYSVWKPFYKRWLEALENDPSLLKAFPDPKKNPAASVDHKIEVLNESEIPSQINGKTLAKEDKKKMKELWPAGEAEASRRLTEFINGDIIKTFDMTRRMASAKTAFSELSLYISAGSLVSRTAVRVAAENNGGSIKDGKDGLRNWISAFSWRDFFKHGLIHWPYICMNKPFKTAFSDVVWLNDREHFAAWCEGRTGYPLIDAAMRQMNSTGYMHNRCRVVVASFLAKHLYLDWRLGEKYFMDTLIDCDWVLNNAGWGVAVGCGMAPHTYIHRIFNPTLQSEQFDKEGSYIRQWVPELRSVKGKAIHDPYGRGSGVLAKEAGYPKMMINHKEARERCLSMLTKALKEDDE